jgi:hypothetical protein
MMFIIPAGSGTGVGRIGGLATDCATGVDVVVGAATGRGDPVAVGFGLAPAPVVWCGSGVPTGDDPC